MIAVLAFVALGQLYGQGPRVQMLESELRAMAATPASELDATLAWLEQTERSSCRSEFHRLKVECLLAAAARRCEGAEAERCKRYADVAATRTLTRDELVPERKRQEIMSASRDYRAALGRELERVEARLLLDLYARGADACAASDSACLAVHIDAYCLEAADHRDLSWQACAAHLVWFMARGK